MAYDMCLLALNYIPEGFYEVKLTNLTSLLAGDLLLRKINKNLPEGSANESLNTLCLRIAKCYHAGIYCGNNEVIEFSPPPETTCFTACLTSSSSGEHGEIRKIHVRKFADVKDLSVLRLKGAVPRALANNISEAMGKNISYGLMSFNCVHFALCILEKSKWPFAKSEANAIPGNAAALNPTEESTEGGNLLSDMSR